MIDVREIKLSMRYPESRQEDITDAFTRGYTGAVEIGNKAIKKLEAENAKLRELVKAAWGCVNRHVSCDECRMSCGGCTLQSAMRELGIEVQP